MDAVGISLWWQPTGNVAQVLQARIDALAVAHGAPRFAAHVTLIGRLTGDRPAVLSGCEALAGRLAPFEIELQEHGHERVWTRWLFRYVAPTPAVMGANRAARDVFDRHLDRLYVPHSSLLYGEFDHARTEASLATLPAPATRFRVDVLHAVLTDGPVEGWRRIASFPLGG
jgi:hypothetical protein